MNSKESKNKRRLKRKLFHFKSKRKLFYFKSKRKSFLAFKNKKRTKIKFDHKILCKMLYNIFLILILFGINFNTYQKDFRNQIKTIHKSKYEKKMIKKI